MPPPPYTHAGKGILTLCCRIDSYNVAYMGATVAFWQCFTLFYHFMILL